MVHGIGVLGFHHLAFRVTNLPRTVDFYRSMMGLELQFLQEVAVKAPESIDADQVRVEMATMELNGVRIEFAQFLEPQIAPYEDNTKAGPPHIAFQVRDVQAAYERLKKAGVQFVLPVTIFEGKDRMFCQLRDPDDYVVELVEEMPVNLRLREMAERIRETRLARRMTLKTVAAESGMSGANLSQVEHGETIPSVTSLLRLARALGVSADYLLRPANGGDLLDRVLEEKADRTRGGDGASACESSSSRRGRRSQRV